MGLDTGYLVCSNGAVTATVHPPEVLDVVTFDPAPAIRILREHVPDGLFAVEELGVGHRVSAPFPDGELSGRLTVTPFDRLVERPATRVVLRSPGHDVHEFGELVARAGLRDVTYTVGHTAWLDIAPEGVSKASALQGVCDVLGIDRGSTAAIGDGRNDIEMLRWAGTGVAMGDAPAEVQDAADVVTRTFADGGLAAALDRWFG